MLDPGLGVLGRNEPLPLGQADMRPLSLTGLADAGAVAEHHQGEHGIRRRAGHGLPQLGKQVLKLGDPQPGWLHTDLGLGEVAELDVLHRVRRYQPELERLAEGQGQQLERRAHVIDANGFLRRPHELIVERGLVDGGQWHGAHRIRIAQGDRA